MTQWSRAGLSTQLALAGRWQLPNQPLSFLIRRQDRRRTVIGKGFGGRLQPGHDGLLDDCNYFISMELMKGSSMRIRSSHEAIKSR
jgi:hypothetical protein